MCTKLVECVTMQYGNKFQMLKQFTINGFIYSYS